VPPPRTPPRRALGLHAIRRQQRPYHLLERVVRAAHQPLGRRRPWHGRRGWRWCVSCGCRSLAWAGWIHAGNVALAVAVYRHPPTPLLRTFSLCHKSQHNADVKGGGIGRTIPWGAHDLCSSIFIPGMTR
jgi:hypothetical protein